MEAQQYGPLRMVSFVDDLFGENTFVLWSDRGTQCWVIDPGFPPATEHAAAAIHRQELRLEAIVLTHGHGDHLAGASALRELHPDASLIAPRDDAHMLDDPEANLSAMFGGHVVAPQADQLITGDQRLHLGELEVLALDVSGHSPGGLAFYIEAAGVVLTGDALFAGGIGRTDFPGSDLQRLRDNISRNLLTLPDDTVAFPGHGPSTTIGHERVHNPFVQRGYGQ